MTNSFVIRQNIIRYLQLLQLETDPERKRLLLRLLGEEQAKSRDHSASDEMNENKTPAHG